MIIMLAVINQPQFAEAQIAFMHAIFDSKLKMIKDMLAICFIPRSIEFMPFIDV